MRRTICLCVLALIVLSAVSVARAEKASDLLEKGIYTEETVGDLDAAMKIYKKIVADGKANRPFVARAQYRLGMCLLKKGKKKEAKKTFEDLAKRFPEQKELVAKAKKHFETQLKLIPATWKDGEVFHMALKLASGKTLGNYIFQAKATQYKGKKVWQLQYWQRLGGVARSGVSRVQADFQSLRPIHSLVDNSMLGCYDADYAPTEVTVRSTIRGKTSTRKASVQGPVYDNEEGYWVFRCLPLEVGYHVEVPIFATFGSNRIGLPVNVTSKEKLKVAAGQFECYKLDLGLVNQTFWVSADKNRHLVKFEAGALSGELIAVNPKDIHRFASKKWGCSIEAPKGWFIVKSGDFEPDELLVNIIDPQSAAVTVLAVKKLKEAKPDERLTARRLAEKNMPELAGQFKDFKVRADSWTERTISGRPAVGFLADFLAGGEKKVGYVTCVLGETMGARVFVQVSATDLDAARKRFDPVIDTLKVK